MGHKERMPVAVLGASRARVSHVFGKVGAMLQSTVEGLVCLEESSARWPGFSGDTGLLRETFVQHDVKQYDQFSLLRRDLRRIAIV
ncbi:hypothetical protein WN51_05668 [Melipona quadrifasciata]|uniref:Uncharacterized protein n=1 Tax=Melipona quadrifasciata TaxID=166423 RepID=A0A0N0U3Y0_9HYME|nr:hypothetical protein WN51_05668 [Melipona quadrifasciata]